MFGFPMRSSTFWEKKTKFQSLIEFLFLFQAQPKHLACIAVSSFHLACQEHHKLLQEKDQLPAAMANNNHANSKATFAIPDPADLVSISQARCTQGDLLRMQEIVAKKLHVGAAGGANPGAATEAPITALSFLRLLHRAARTATSMLGLPDLLPEESLPDHLVHQLEILACDSLTLDFRPCEVALALLATEFQTRASARAAQPAHANALHRIVAELQAHLGVSAARFAEVHGVVVTQLENYNTEGTVVHRQRLTWKLSNRTLRLLRPTDRLRKILPTISEDQAGSRMR